MSIENQTLAHFRHFSSLFTLSPLYTCKESSTNQLLNMQNKPNFRKAQMNVKPYNTTNYKRIRDWTLGQNKPNSNPIKPNFKRAKMNINSIITKDYRKKDDFEVRINKPNSKPISGMSKMNVNLYILKDYENKTALRLEQNKPNSNPILKISILNYVNLRKLFPPNSFLLPTLNLTFQRLSLRPPGGLFSQLTAQLISSAHR